MFLHNAHTETNITMFLHNAHMETNIAMFLHIAHTETNIAMFLKHNTHTLKPTLPCSCTPPLQKPRYPVCVMYIIMRKDYSEFAGEAKNSAR